MGNTTTTTTTTQKIHSISSKGGTNIIEISRNKRDRHIDITIILTSGIISFIMIKLGVTIEIATSIAGIIFCVFKITANYINRKYNIYRVDDNGNIRFDGKILNQIINIKIK